jgi:hypothetical protein
MLPNENHLMKISPTCLPLLCPTQVRDDLAIPQSVVRQLGFGDVADNRAIDHIRDADHALQEAGYKFIGYHGTNKSNLRNMCETGLNQKFCGSGDGQARGSGLYIARSPEKALDYADASTQAGDPQPPHYDVTPRHDGERGIQELARVYAKNFDAFHVGKDMAWGIESSDGDPNGDKRLLHTDSGDRLLENRSNLEMVVAPAKYNSLAVLPSLHEIQEENLLSEMSAWPTHSSWY